MTRDRIDRRELAPGDHEVSVDGQPMRVLVPAGVGVPGVPEEELVVLLVTVLLERGTQLPPVIDVSRVFGAEPGLVDRIAELAEE